MSKVRVSALAKDRGETSKVVLERLNAMGEYVKSASSTIEAPVVRRYNERFPAEAAASKAATSSAIATAAAVPSATMRGISTPVISTGSTSSAA